METASEEQSWDGTERRQKTFWNGTATKVLMVLVALLAFLGSHLFREVCEVPKIYAVKSEMSMLADRMDKGFKELREGINDINQFLRDQNRP